MVMANVFDGLPMEITCPKCGKHVKETFGWFRVNGRSCPSCNMSFDTSGLSKSVEEARARIEATLKP